MDKSPGVFSQLHIPLDIFRSMPHNKMRELDAWLYFLSSDDPKNIQHIAQKYPFFEELYQDIIRFRYQPKEVIRMYSEALAIMDKNTVDCMIDEMRAELRQAKNSLQQTKISLQQTENSLQQKNQTIHAQDNEIRQQKSEIRQKDSALQQKDALIRELQNRLMLLEKER